MRLSIDFKWYDMWIGAFYDRVGNVLYVCPFPMFVIRIKCGARVKS